MPNPTRLSALEVLERLIAFPTVSADSNLDCVDFIKSYLQEFGVSSKVIPNTEGTKANILATVGPQPSGGVVLSAHTDVVPIEGQQWAASPWVLRRENRRLYGRGACDMKGFIAAVLAAVPDMLDARLDVPIHIALSYDEEVGQKGVPSLIDEMKRTVAAPRAVIVGEASRLRPVSGHKGTLCFYTDVRGHTYHSSRMDLGVSAVMVGARLVTWFADVTEENKRRARPSKFLPPYTTLHCGVIHGGIAPNIMAKDCRFVTEMRSVPDEGPSDYEERYRRFIREQIEPQMKAVAPASGVDIVPRSFVPGLRPEKDGVAEALVRKLSGFSQPSLNVSYGTEAGQFQAEGWSSVVCGSGDGAQAHQADEYLDEDQFEACSAFVSRLIDELRA